LRVFPHNPVIPVAEILTKHRHPFLTAIGLKISEIAYFSIASVFVISYATGHLDLPRSVIPQSVQMSATVALIAIPTFGWLADNLTRKKMFIASCLFSIAFACPMFWLLDNDCNGAKPPSG
jgi:MHS family shikimate/dehydroshikimate transporter-like MFS transporter